ncbi:hypothetical protein C9374_003479 [Naegleria lovaniensis]|uniref:Uncharacterized protein n=1 Tax=Naegleria lovaniensis TaxID=51637 RepID=A0AA88GT55_NAELO|nr:uncharacterized protein C9374_003479 [Naegleria lovaniensis]KAG2385664.1 hypothetical protein C9374_003479 [Naegleria lovaniensis]
MNQPEFSDGMVLLLRYLTASHVFEKNHSLDMYFEFQSLDTGKSISTLIHDYVLKEVMPMGIEAEEIQINSLITVLKHLFNGCQVNFCFQLHIYHVSHSQERLTCLKYPPTHSTQLDAKESCDGAEDRFNTILSLLFRPGHYDSIVYSPSFRQTNETQCK